MKCSVTSFFCAHFVWLLRSVNKNYIIELVPRALHCMRIQWTFCRRWKTFKIPIEICRTQCDACESWEVWTFFFVCRLNALTKQYPTIDVLWRVVEISEFHSNSDATTCCVSVGRRRRQTHRRPKQKIIHFVSITCKMLVRCENLHSIPAAQSGLLLVCA